jgi:hypothetical protein
MARPKQTGMSPKTAGETQQDLDVDLEFCQWRKKYFKLAIPPPASPTPIHSPLAMTLQRAPESCAGGYNRTGGGLLRMLFDRDPHCCWNPTTPPAPTRDDDPHRRRSTLFLLYNCRTGEGEGATSAIAGCPRPKLIGYRRRPFSSRSIIFRRTGPGSLDVLCIYIYKCFDLDAAKHNTASGAVQLPKPDEYTREWLRLFV